MANNKKLKILLDKKKAFSAEEAQEYGISPQQLAYYCKQGIINRVCRGVYEPLNCEINPYMDVEQLIKKKSKFVVCLLSALQLHEFTTQLPHELWIAIPRGTRVPKLKTANLRYFQFSKASYSFGVEIKELYGMKIPVYSPAKTVADCFKFRNRIGIDVALEALQDGLRQKLFTANEISQAAKACRVYKVMYPYLETVFA
jgi:predicted transcriptional regulator of viral defense system